MVRFFSGWTSQQRQSAENIARRYEVIQHKEGIFQTGITPKDWVISQVASHLNQQGWSSPDSKNQLKGKLEVISKEEGVSVKLSNSARLSLEKQTVKDARRLFKEYNKGENRNYHPFHPMSTSIRTSEALKRNTGFSRPAQPNFLERARERLKYGFYKNPENPWKIEERDQEWMASKTHSRSADVLVAWQNAYIGLILDHIGEEMRDVKMTTVEITWEQQQQFAKEAWEIGVRPFGKRELFKVEGDRLLKVLGMERKKGAPLSFDVRPSPKTNQAPYHKELGQIALRRSSLKVKENEETAVIVDSIAKSLSDAGKPPPSITSQPHGASSVSEDRTRVGAFGEKAYCSKSNLKAAFKEMATEQPDVVGKPPIIGQMHFTDLVARMVAAKDVAVVTLYNKLLAEPMESLSEDDMTILVSAFLSGRDSQESLRSMVREVSGLKRNKVFLRGLKEELEVQFAQGFIRFADYAVRNPKEFGRTGLTRPDKMKTLFKLYLSQNYQDFNRRPIVISESDLSERNGCYRRVYEMVELKSKSKPDDPIKVIVRGAEHTYKSVRAGIRSTFKGEDKEDQLEIFVEKMMGIQDPNSTVTLASSEEALDKLLGPEVDTLKKSVRHEMVMGNVESAKLLWESELERILARRISHSPTSRRRREKAISFKDLVKAHRKAEMSRAPRQKELGDQIGSVSGRMDELTQGLEEKRDELQKALAKKRDLPKGATLLEKERVTLNVYIIRDKIIEVERELSGLQREFEFLEKAYVKAHSLSGNPVRDTLFKFTKSAFDAQWLEVHPEDPLKGCTLQGDMKVLEQPPKSTEDQSALMSVFEDWISDPRACDRLVKGINAHRGLGVAPLQADAAGVYNLTELTELVGIDESLTPHEKIIKLQKLYEPGKAVSTKKYKVYRNSRKILISAVESSRGYPREIIGLLNEFSSNRREGLRDRVEDVPQVQDFIRRGRLILGKGLSFTTQLGDEFDESCLLRDYNPTAQREGRPERFRDSTLEYVEDQLEFSGEGVFSGSTLDALVAELKAEITKIEGYSSDQFAKTEQMGLLNKKRCISDLKASLEEIEAAIREFKNSIGVVERKAFEFDQAYNDLKKMELARLAPGRKEAITELHALADFELLSADIEIKDEDSAREFLRLFSGVGKKQIEMTRVGGSTPSFKLKVKEALRVLSADRCLDLDGIEFASGPSKEVLIEFIEDEFLEASILHPTHPFKINFGKNIDALKLILQKGGEVAPKTSDRSLPKGISSFGSVNFTVDQEIPLMDYISEALIVDFVRCVNFESFSINGISVKAAERMVEVVSHKVCDPRKRAHCLGLGIRNPKDQAEIDYNLRFMNEYSFPVISYASLNEETGVPVGSEKTVSQGRWRYALMQSELQFPDPVNERVPSVRLARQLIGNYELLQACQAVIDCDEESENIAEICSLYPELQAIFKELDEDKGEIQELISNLIVGEGGVFKVSSVNNYVAVNNASGDDFSLNMLLNSLENMGYGFEWDKNGVCSLSYPEGRFPNNSLLNDYARNLLDHLNEKTLIESEQMKQMALIAHRAVNPSGYKQTGIQYANLPKSSDRSSSRTASVGPTPSSSSHSSLGATRSSASGGGRGKPLSSSSSRSREMSSLPSRASSPPVRTVHSRKVSTGLAQPSKEEYLASSITKTLLVGREGAKDAVDPSEISDTTVSDAHLELSLDPNNKDYEDQLLIAKASTYLASRGFGVEGQEFNLFSSFNSIFEKVKKHIPDDYIKSYCVAIDFWLTQIIAAEEVDINKDSVDVIAEQIRPKSKMMPLTAPSHLPPVRVIGDDDDDDDDDSDTGALDELGIKE